MTARRAVPIAAPWLAMLFATAAVAQPRPSLTDAESRITTLEGQVGALESALAQVSSLESTLAQVISDSCAATDVAGDTYRPAYCPAECRCVTDLSAATGCSVTTTSSTTYRIDATVPLQECSHLTFLAQSYCVSGEACTTDADCMQGFTCDVLDGVCADLSTTCSIDSDCPPGAPSAVQNRWSLSVPIGGTDASVATCNDPYVSPSSHAVSQKDALECVAQIEGVIGQACSASP